MGSLRSQCARSFSSLKECLDTSQTTTLDRHKFLEEHAHVIADEDHLDPHTNFSSEMRKKRQIDVV